MYVHVYCTQFCFQKSHNISTSNDVGMGFLLLLVILCPVCMLPSLYLRNICGLWQCHPYICLICLYYWGLCIAAIYVLSKLLFIKILIWPISQLAEVSDQSYNVSQVEPPIHSYNAIVIKTQPYNLFMLIIICPQYVHTRMGLSNLFHTFC